MIIVLDTTGENCREQSMAQHATTDRLQTTANRRYLLIWQITTVIGAGKKGYWT